MLNSEISSLDLLGNDRVLTTGGDGFIKIIDYVQQTIAKSFKVCELNIPMSIPLKENEIYAVIIFLLSAIMVLSFD